LSVLDVDAVRAVTRLIDKGFEAYLVGGCVRDLLLDRTPKDYDIATEARPPQVKRTFPRNCRIIGRRFKLAHLHFHGNTKILECSTFRRTPQEKPEGEGDDADLLITHDNEFGTAEEDALRRDFTVNALFLDPTRDLIVDHCKGLEDIEAKVIRTIGDPVVRFREDPVRILRAAKFAGRLGFTVEKHTLAAMSETAEDLVRAAPPRVLEEILRLLRSGHAKSSFELLRDVNAIEHLIPVVGKFLKKATTEQHDAFWGLLDALDSRVQSQPANSEPPPNGVLLAVMMYGAVEAGRNEQPTRSASSIAEKLLGSLAVDLRLPRRDSGCLKRICGVQHRFEQAEDKRRFRVDAFVHSPYFEETLQFYALRTAAAGKERSNVDHWYDLAGTHPIEDDEPGTHDNTTNDNTTDAGTEASSASDGGAEGDETGPRKKRRRRRRSAADKGEATAATTEEADATKTEAPLAVEHDSSADTTPTNDSPEGDIATAKDEATLNKEEPVLKKKATRKKAAKKRTTRKASRPEEDDLSDVTFPSSDEPAPHGDPTQERSDDEPRRPRAKQSRRSSASRDDDNRDASKDNDQHDADRRDADRRDADRRKANPRDEDRRDDNRRDAERRDAERRDDNRRDNDRRDTDRRDDNRRDAERRDAERRDQYRRNKKTR
jgi:poly(A) polymerase